MRLYPFSELWKFSNTSTPLSLSVSFSLAVLLPKNWELKAQVVNAGIRRGNDH